MGTHKASSTNDARKTRARGAHARARPSPLCSYCNIVVRVVLHTK